MIDAENLTRRFGDLTAVDNLTLHVDEGEVFGFLGPNGAGKTTTIRMLACLISKTSGTAKIGDYEIGNKADQPKIRGMIGLVPDNVGLYEELSAYENLDLYGRYYKVDESKRKERIEYFLKLLGLWDKKDLAAGTFSKGMKQKLAIARALIHDPKVLFMDEPTANLDPEASKTIRGFILDMKKQKKTIFLNTHNLDEAQRICDRIAILNTRLMALGTPAELERSVSGRKTVVQLERVNDAIISAVKKVATGGVEVDEGNKLIIGVGNPEKENPDIMSAIGAAGGRIQFVTEASSTLEDVYLKLVRSE
ncbi:MAG: ABC transporter ATP-binding protein [Thaumarchaeota archaeon]|nr:ABC transporter ATP-binding protein [Nitrososphaerota archaeon]